MTWKSPTHDQVFLKENTLKNLCLKLLHLFVVSHRYTAEAVTATTFGASPSRATTLGKHILFYEYRYSLQLAAKDNEEVAAAL